jgi:transcriptional regulator with XRE-family HTH domain
MSQLLDEWQKHGFDGFMSMKNLGKKSVKELELFIQALCHSDHDTASLFLPLCPSRSGLSLPVALASLAELPKAAERQMLERRLISRMTLEESAEEAGVTRERVRQIEAGFLSEIEERLNYFASERDELLHAWVTGRDWLEILRPINENDLVKAAIEAIFDETPQACARDLTKEATWESWREEIRTHSDLWFGGVELERFLADRVPINQTEEFCECIASSRELRLDHGSGRVLPIRTSLYLTVVAMLAREDDAIPLTWLVKLLVESGFHPTATKQTLKRHRKSWLSRSDFESNKILWNE